MNKNSHTAISRLLVVLSACLTLAACDHMIPDEPGPLPPPPPFDGSLYYPLDTGNYWKLRNEITGISVQILNERKVEIEGKSYTWQRVDTLNNNGLLITRHWRLLHFSVDTLYRAYFTGNPPDSVEVYRQLPIRLFNPYGIGQYIETIIRIDKPGVSDKARWEVYDADISLNNGNRTWHDAIQLNLDYLYINPYGTTVHQLVIAEFYEKRIGPIRVYKNPYRKVPGDAPDSLELYNLVEWNVK